MRISDWSSDVCSSDLINGQSKSIGVLTVSSVEREDYKINARTLVDLSAGIATTDGRWRAGLWGKNVLNKYYWTNAIQAYDNIMRYAARPAEYGLTVRSEEHTSELQSLMRTSSAAFF